MNIIPTLVKINDLEFFEEFMINEIMATRVWRFTQNNLEFYDPTVGDFWKTVNPEFIGNLVLCKITIFKIPYKPSAGDPYFTFSISYKVEPKVWTNSIDDFTSLNNRQVFKTKSQAEQARDRKFKFLYNQDYKEGLCPQLGI